MLSQLTDYQKGLLNQIAYTNIPEDDYKSRMTLYDFVRVNNKDLANEIKAAGLGDLVIKEYINNNENNTKSGFCAIAFEDPKTGEVGMSFRGTENADHGQNIAKDMADNIFTAILGTSPQSVEAMDFYERNKDKNGNNYLYGHSKGGELATSVYVLDYNNIKGVYTINAQPINPIKLLPDEFVALQSEKLEAIVVDGDIVSWLGARLYPVKYVKDNGKNKGFFGPHSISSISYDKNGNAMIAEKPFSNNHFWKGILGRTTFVLGGVVQSLE